MPRPDTRCPPRIGAPGARVRAAVRPALLALPAACTAARPVELTPEARGARVRVTFAAPQDVVLGRAGDDALRLRGVRRLDGQLAGRVGDTLVLSPVAFAATTTGALADPRPGRVATARVALGEGVSAADTRRAVSGGRTVLHAVGVLAVVTWLAAALSSMEIGVPDN